MSGFQNCTAVGTVFLNRSCLNCFIMVFLFHNGSLLEPFQHFRHLLQEFQIQVWHVFFPHPVSPRPCTDTGKGRGGTAATAARACGNGFLLNARESYKYPKDTHLVSNFSNLNHSTFHTIFNVGLKEFLLLLIPLAIELGQLPT